MGTAVHGPSPQPSDRQSLSADDWATAALDAMAAGGLGAVAIEPLARQLGVTKGSFYWHFANRDALIEAALERWEREETDDIMARVGDEQDPYERIVRVFKAANASYRSGRLYLALAAASDRPSIQQVVRRVSERRLSFLLDCYRALGLSEADARRWSTFAYATFMGNLQIRRDVPEAIPENQQFNDYLRLMIQTLIPRVREEAPHTPAAESDTTLRAVG
ncbi:TetR/AcrR family transcriptional regulator [Algiphilus sp. NNCM1]|nr:TetR/AcrR family transcriptional regulator [Algiphilus acroporae]